MTEAQAIKEVYDSYAIINIDFENFNEQVYIYICIYIYMYVYIRMCMCMYTYTYRPSKKYMTAMPLLT